MARGIEAGYADLNPATAWPVRPWSEAEPFAAAPGTAEPATESGAESGTAAPARGKSRDRGASAVEWVVITAIVVAIVTGVGILISNAVKAKATNACQEIVNTDTSTGGTGTTAGAAGC